MKLPPAMVKFFYFLSFMAVLCLAGEIASANSKASLKPPPPRPDLHDIYPETDPSLRDFLLRQTGHNASSDETIYKLASGEGLAKLLLRGGLSVAETEDALRIISEHRSLRRLPVGFPVHIIAPDASRPGAIRVAINNEQDLNLYQNSDKSWATIRSFRPYQLFLTYASGTIDTSLYVSAKKAGLSEAALDEFARIMSFSVDFQREIRRGDGFEALVQTKRDLITGKRVSNTDIHYLSMTLSGKRLEFFRYEHQSGDSGYYDRDGKSAARTLMRTPINGARLSSGFGMRKHPVLGYSKAHRGVDFAAASGTPIMAAGSGIVEYAGWNGSYGRYVRIRHNGTYKTAYAHLSRISKGLSPGSRVSQGDVIGRVGSSGRSTGPHLHYEILVSGTKVNPLTVRLPASRGLDESERETFLANVDIITDELLSRGIVRYAGDVKAAGAN